MLGGADNSRLTLDLATNFNEEDDLDSNKYLIDNFNTKDFFADFDLNEIDALQNGDLTLLNDIQKIRHLSATTPTTTITQQQQFDDATTTNYTESNNNIEMFSDNLIKHTNYLNNNNDNFVLDCNNANGTSQCGQTPSLLPPVVISPSEIDSITIQLEKNQQCACKDCGKLFNSVWYLKQHAVKHSNDRPFKCKFCMKVSKKYILEKFLLS